MFFIVPGAPPDQASRRNGNYSALQTENGAWGIPACDADFTDTAHLTERRWVIASKKTSNGPHRDLTETALNSGLLRVEPCEDDRISIIRRGG